MSYDANLANALSAVNTNYDKLAKSIYDQDLPGAYQSYTKIVSSNGLSTYRVDFPGATDRARLWEGSKIVKHFRDNYFSVRVKSYEKTIGIQREDLLYDNGAKIVSAKVGQFLSSNAGEYDKLASAALLANGTGYDGVSLMATNHPHGNSTNSNYSTNAFTRANLDAAMQAMAGWQDEYGEPIPARATTMLCGPKLESKAKEILETGDRAVPVDSTGAETTSFAIGVAAKQNIYQGSLKLVVDPRISGSTYQYYWFLIDESAPASPILGVEGFAPKPVRMDDPKDWNAFNFREYLYSVEFDAVFTVGCWWTIYGNLSTT